LNFKSNAMRRKMIIGIAALVIIALTTWQLFARTNTQDIVFETTHISNGAISNTITATGTLEPITQVEVGTQVSGIIEKIYVDFNHEVKRNQLIAELDKTNLLVNEAQSKVNVMSAKNELDYQSKNLERMKQLYESQSVSDAEFENAQYAYNKAKTSYDKSSFDLEKAQTNLGYANITSPIDGVILNRAVDEGQTVAASLNTPTLFTIARDLTRMQVEANIDEADIGQVKEGQRVIFTVDAFPDDEFTGTVSQIRLSPQVASNVVTYVVIIEAPNPELKLMPGMTASITVYTQHEEDIVTIPAKATRFRPDRELMQDYFKSIGMEMPAKGSRRNNPSVGAMRQGMNGGENMKSRAGMQADEDGVATVWIKDNTQIRPRRIKTGISDGTTIQILEGLEENDELILSMKKMGEDTKSSKNESSVNNPFVPKRPGRGK